jgi:hypothetical protein
MSQSFNAPQTPATASERPTQLSDARLAAVVEAAYILEAVGR